MIFLHGYVPGFWEAYEKRGLINKNSGIRFCQSIDIDDSLKFNSLAAEGGSLFGLVKELNCPFYIDRLQGGCFFEGYDYDMELVGKYCDMLGDKFLGFQMHEWMSNFVSDTDKLVSGGCPEPWTEQNVISTIRKRYDYRHVFTESMSPAELAQAGHITDVDVYLDEMERLFAKRQKYTHGLLLPCDSAMLAYSLEFKQGARHVMPETGQQTRRTGLQMAYARGTARAYKKDFGTYYEPWGGEPFSACNYHRDSANEWNIGGESFPFQTAGGNGGSSRSLQKRIMLYSYLSGAAFISEEWGAYNTFYDTDTFELSPYGQTKLDFIRFTEKYPDIGQPVTPLAVVIPSEITFLDSIDLDPGEHNGFASKESMRPLIKNMREGLRLLYDGPDCLGNENGSLVNTYLPDAFDVVNEDCFNADGYDYILNLTGRDGLEKKYRNCVKPELLQSVFEEILPCTVSGGLHHIINEGPDGSYYLTVFNHTGIIRTVADGEILLNEAEKTVSAVTKKSRQLIKLEGDAKIHSENGKYFISVPAGGFFFGRL